MYDPGAAFYNLRRKIPIISVPTPEEFRRGFPDG
jgi:hypothetical protein